jgi:hypothetical protein
MWPSNRLLTFKKCVTLIRVCGLRVPAPARLGIVLLAAAMRCCITAALLLHYCIALLLTFHTLRFRGARLPCRIASPVQAAIDVAHIGYLSMRFDELN